jgi:hypothetical protein
MSVEGFTQTHCTRFQRLRADEGATMPDGGGARAVRVRISGTFDSETDRAEPEERLLQEDWSKEHAREGLLRVERPDGDPGGGPGSRGTTARRWAASSGTYC